MTKTACPHADIRFCPLYVALHYPELVALGCDDGRLDEGGCAVDRGRDYDDCLGRLRAKAPRLVATIEFDASNADADRQRARNMRAAGLH